RQPAPPFKALPVGRHSQVAIRNRRLAGSLPRCGRQQTAIRCSPPKLSSITPSSPGFGSAPRPPAPPPFAPARLPARVCHCGRAPTPREPCAHTSPATRSGSRPPRQWLALPACPATPLDTSHWALEPACVPGDVAVWAERFEKAEVLFGQLLIDAERSGNPFA